MKEILINNKKALDVRLVCFMIDNTIHLHSQVYSNVVRSFLWVPSVLVLRFILKWFLNLFSILLHPEVCIIKCEQTTSCLLLEEN